MGNRQSELDKRLEMVDRGFIHMINKYKLELKEKLNNINQEHSKKIIKAMNNFDKERLEILSYSLPKHAGDVAIYTNIYLQYIEDAIKFNNSNI